MLGDIRSSLVFVKITLNIKVFRPVRFLKPDRSENFYKQKNPIDLFKINGIKLKP